MSDLTRVDHGGGVTNNNEQSGGADEREGS